MDIRKQIKDLDINISNKCRQMEELMTECDASEKGITVLTDTIRVSRDIAKTRRNNNILVLDDKEKNYEMIISNLKEDMSNYVLVDFDGQYYRDTAEDFKKRGYEIKCINLMDVEHSDGFNPFVYMTNEVDIDTVVQCITSNTTSKYYLQAPGKDRILIKNLEQNFLKILFSTYMKYGTSKSFNAAVNLLRQENREERLEKLFSGKYPQGPGEMECKRFSLFKSDAGERYSDILQSCSERMAVFKDERFIQLAKNEDVGLEELYVGKKILYIILPSTLREAELFTSILLSQILYTLCNESRKHNRDRNVMLYFNYFSDTGVVAYLDRILPDLQHYNVGCMLHINNLARVMQVYTKWEEMLSYCDTVLYMGSNDGATQRYALEHADSAIIRKKKMLGKEVYMSSALKPEELKAMDMDECICIIKGMGTFLSRLAGSSK